MVMSGVRKVAGLYQSLETQKVRKTFRSGNKRIGHSDEIHVNVRLVLQHRKCTCKVILKRVRVTIVAVKKQ